MTCEGNKIFFFLLLLLLVDMDMETGINKMREMKNGGGKRVLNESQERGYIMLMVEMLIFQSKGKRRKENKKRVKTAEESR